MKTALVEVAIAILLVVLFSKLYKGLSGEEEEQRSLDLTSPLVRTNAEAEATERRVMRLISWSEPQRDRRERQQMSA